MIQCPACGAANFDNSPSCQQCRNPLASGAYPPAGGFGAPPQGGGFGGPPQGGGFGGPPQGGGFGGPPQGGGFGGPPQGGGFGGPPQGGGFGGPPQGGGFGMPPANMGFGPPGVGPGPGYAPGASGRVAFVGTGGGLFLIYLLAYFLPTAISAGLFIGVPNLIANNEQDAMAVGIPLFMIALLCILPFTIHKVLAFHWNNTVIDGKPCRYSGTAFGLIGALAIHYILFAIIPLGIYGPFFFARFKHYVYSKVDVGGERLEFRGDPGGFIGTWILGTLLTACTGGIYGAWFMSDVLEWSWQNSTISGRTFRFQKDPAGLLVTYLLTVVISYCTAFIYLPWGICRIWRWEAEHVS